MADRRFAGTGVMVTGASRGLGRAIAIAFGREGARVGVGFRTRRVDADATLAAVRGAGGDGASVQLDLRDAASIEAAFQTFGAAGAVDTVVNNAAAVRDGLFATSGIEPWDEVLSVNLRGVALCCQAAVRAMLPRRRGAIINIASIAGLRASPGQSNYAASKGGVMALTATLGAELAPFGIRVNAVAPGLLDTGMGERLDRNILAQRTATIPLRRTGTGAEIAGAVLFLASPDASYIVGQCLAVDGGLSL